MKDPHVHVEKTLPGMGQIEMSSLIARAIGVAPDLPKTGGTGCGKRRQLADTSTVPEKVTCLACREWAAEREIEMAGSAEALASLGDPELARLAEPGKPALTMAQLQEMAAGHRVMAARYGWRDPDQAADGEAEAAHARGREASNPHDRLGTAGLPVRPGSAAGGQQRGARPGDRMTTCTPRSAADALLALRGRGGGARGAVHGGRARYVPNVKAGSDGWPVSNHNQVLAEAWPVVTGDDAVEALAATLAQLPGAIDSGLFRAGDPGIGRDRRPYAWVLLPGDGSDCYHGVERWTKAA